VEVPDGPMSTKSGILERGDTLGGKRAGLIAVRRRCAYKW